jgi:hypothetical protein
VNHRFLRAAAFALGVLTVSSATFADVELKAEERENLGIQTQPAQPIEVPRRWQASAQVLDVTPLITTLSELQAAETAAGASRAEAERSERLYKEDTNIARKALDAARAQAMTDETRARTARAQLFGTWGRMVGGLAPAARNALIDDLLAGRASLVRADMMELLPAAPSAAPTVRVASLDGRSEWPAQWLGALPQTTNTTFGGAVLLRVATDLPMGQPLQVALSDPRATRKGLGAPSTAVIRWRGDEWVYEETAANHFVRQQVAPGAHIDGRALLAGDAKTTPKIVTVGARALLAAELGASDSADAPEEGE